MYNVSSGQNIFDVALAVHGTIEGLFDLMVNNPELSFETRLAGEMALAHDDTPVNKDIVDTLRNDGITPANGDRGVYYKDAGVPVVCVIDVPADEYSFTISLSGDGEMLVDWGDNTDIERIGLTTDVRPHKHYFDNRTGSRMVRLYGDFAVRVWDMSSVTCKAYVIRPMVVDEVVLRDTSMPVGFLAMFSGTYAVDMAGVALNGLSAIRDMNLQSLSLVRINWLGTSALDDYLVYLAKNNNGRRPCRVTIDTQPSGEYSEPARGSSGSYEITSGMDAVWVITHESEWNKSGAWVFDICGTEYKYENDEEA